MTNQTAVARIGAAPMPPEQEPDRPLAGLWWASALSLPERCALSAAATPPNSAESVARARRRLARWRAAYWFTDLDDLVERLAGERLTEPQFLALLAEQPVALAGRAESPRWSSLVEAVVAGIPTDRDVPRPMADGEALGLAGLAAIVAPFTDHAVDRFAAAVGVEQLTDLVEVDALLGGLRADLERTLVTLAARTLVLELHVLRVTGRLVGKTSEDRFWAFVRHFVRPDGLGALLAEYPVLARLLAETADQAATGWAELLGRLAADRVPLQDVVFAGADLGRLVEARQLGSGPFRHRSGTVLLRFAGGAQVVYRPHSVELHSRFGEAVEWLNRRLPGLGLRRIKLVDGDGHGWLEYVQPTSCSGRAETERLYYRWGALLALLRALGARLDDGDVVVCGNQPVPVDLSGLFQPTSPPEADASADPAVVALEASVRRAGVLPAPASAADNRGGTAGPSPRWAAPGTDQMRLVRPPAAPAQQSLSPPMAEPAEPLGARTDLIAGHGAAHAAITAGREDLIGEAGLVWRFAEAGRRVRPRIGHGYDTLLAESTHPDVLRDALDRDRVLARLWPASAGKAGRDLLVAGELADLRVATIPSASGRAGSRDLWAAKAGVSHDVVPSGVSDAVERIRAMDPDDRTAQEWILRAWVTETSVRPLPPDLRTERPAPTSTGPRPAPDVEPQRCLTAARRIADRLAETAHRGDGRVAWLGLTSLDEVTWAVRPLNAGLYDGYPGVALFLAKLAELTGDERHAVLARRALTHVPAMLDGPVGLVDGADASGCGPFHGITGLAYALVQVAASLRDASLLDGVLPPILAAGMAASSDERPRLLDGLSGCLAAMLAIDHALGSPAALRVAQSCARRLTRLVAPPEDGVPWQGRTLRTGPHVGFARGASGVGWALSRYAAAVGDQDAAEAGAAAFAHERALWRPDAASQQPAAPGPARLGWCAGAAGIGLARVAGPIAGDLDVAEDLDTAVRAVVTAGPLADHSLCHGELGVLELLAGAIASGRTDLVPAYRRRVNGLLDDLDRRGPRCGTPDGIPTPGLLTGLAGIGYGLLRLAFPDRVPSVLLLEPPRARRSPIANGTGGVR